MKKLLIRLRQETTIVKSWMSGVLRADTPRRYRRGARLRRDFAEVTKETMGVNPWCFIFILALLFLSGAYQAHAEEGQVVQGRTMVLETSEGTIELNLFCDVAPKACENFIGLVNKGYYDGVIFHRVIKGFMIQGGDPTGTGAGGESIFGEPFEDEVRPEVTFDKAGVVAMANAGPGTNGSQFFITVAATPWLNGHHTIFGKVSAGYDVGAKNRKYADRRRRQAFERSEDPPRHRQEVALGLS